MRRDDSRRDGERDEGGGVAGGWNGVLLRWDEGGELFFCASLPPPASCNAATRIQARHDTT